MRMYVAGEWRTAAAEDEIRSPWSGEVVDTVPRAGAADAEDALRCADMQHDASSGPSLRQLELALVHASRVVLRDVRREAGDRHLDVVGG